MVLGRLGCFSNNHATLTQVATPQNAGIGAFDSLHRHHSTIFDDHSLANVEPTNGLGHFKAKLHISQLSLGGLALGENARCRQQRLNEEGLVHNLDALALQLLHNGVHNSIVLAVGHTGENFYGTQIRHDRSRLIKHLLGYLANHGYLGHLVLFQGGNNLAYFANIDIVIMVHAGL